MTWGDDRFPMSFVDPSNQPRRQNNLILGASAAVFSGWNPLVKGGNTTLSNNNKTQTINGAASNSTLGTQAYVPGATRYFEVTVNSTDSSNNLSVGLGFGAGAGTVPPFTTAAPAFQQQGALGGWSFNGGIYQNSVAYGGFGGNFGNVGTVVGVSLDSAGNMTPYINGVAASSINITTGIGQNITDLTKVFPCAGSSNSGVTASLTINTGPNASFAAWG